MAHVLVVGAGLAGCTAALELANSGVDVTVIEKSAAIGGKVRFYGCKATDRCNNCGLCLVNDLWNRVGSHEKINVVTGSELIDMTGSKGNFKIIVRSGKGTEALSGIISVVVSTGFQEFSSISSGSLEFESDSSIITGCQLEKIIYRRSRDRIFDRNSASIAFIQCFGSRDVREKARYCSKVCCGYAARTARVLRQYYPQMEIVFFYMDLQQVENGDYFSALIQENIEFVRCRPVRLKKGSPAVILYERPGTDQMVERKFDLVVLSEGIHPCEDTDRISEICMLGVDERGFIKQAKDGSATGIYTAGCVSGPKRIEEVYTESLHVARQLINDNGGIGSI